ncbi:MAG: hypothetical protein EOS36_28825 [Mesorhizobium sp.]|uniref:hypothetical protein n=1 Tax=Mesorhizobium sp. TaxID=1871066 RepID=UPI000FE8FB58|nr:hypothetical protein [Mesorhizobium sp.]RWD54319.1 MAG: hypothetical protein EOS36_28825 [Mesorhizobium sp.]RWE36604.1 MAG: hypothetical protein EOS79_25695 [Mesorhizobium sp.]
MMSMAGLLHGTSRFARGRPRIGLAARDRDHSAEKPDELEPVASPSVLGPVIRYLALAFIFFQVATTAALATQVVLFAGDAAGALSSTEPASASLTPSISPLVAETAGRPEARQMEHLLIQIDPGEQASPVND